MKLTAFSFYQTIKIMKARNQKELEFIIKTASRVIIVFLYFALILTILTLSQ